jgi:hypothetical protein
MQLSSIIYASIVALGAVVFATDGASASIDYSASKSNTGNFTFDPHVDLGAAKQCTDSGGTVKAGPRQAQFLRDTGEARIKNRRARGAVEIANLASMAGSYLSL